MTPTEIRTFVQRHADHVCSHDATRMAADYAEDGVVESPSTGTHRGRQQIEESYKTWVAAFPDLELTVDDVVAELGRAAVFFQITGTHQGDFLGLSPTGKRIEFRGVFLQEWKKNQIVNERRIYDFSGLLIKLGVLKVKPG